MFIENILPSALSSFYFFDGEKIAELAVAKTDDQMKASIRSMLGMTTFLIRMMVALLFLELMRNKIIKKLVFMMLRTFKRKLTSNACR